MINWTKVHELRDEIGEEDFGEIVECFLDEVETELSTLVEKPSDDLGACMHFLKGSALNLGFDAFAELCRAGETLCSNGKADQVDRDQIQVCYRSSKEQLLAAL